MGLAACTVFLLRCNKRMAGINAGRVVSRHTLSRNDQMQKIVRSWQAALFGEECNTLTPP
jgi:hypothetical protein